MFRRVSRDFHESYFEHLCKIVEEKDVLHIDIAGGWLASLQRWWHGLFLLSRNDVRAKAFFMSSEAMKTERMIHFRQFRSRIHPLSWFRNFWDCLVLFLLTANEFIFQHNTSILYHQVIHSFQYIGMFFDMVIICDVIVNLFSGYIDHEARKIVLNTQEGLHHYASTKLFLHFASAIPLQWFLCLRYGSDMDCTLCKINKFVEILKLISIFRLIRIYEYSSVLTREWHSYKLTHAFRFCRIYYLGVLTMMKLTDLSDSLVIWTMIANQKIDDNAFISLLIRQRYVDNVEEFNFCKYYYARVFKSIYMFSFSIRRTAFYLDKLVSLIAYLMANLFYFWGLVEVHAFINRTSFFQERIYNLNNMLHGLASSRQFPDKLSHKMDGYLRFNLAQMKEVEDYNNLFQALPEVILREIKLASRYNYIKRIPYFAEWPPEIVEDITLMLQEEIFMKNEMIAEPWVPGEGLFVLFVGEVAVYNGENEIGHLIDGDYFGELALVTDNEVRTSTVLAINSCMARIWPLSHLMESDDAAEDGACLHLFQIILLLDKSHFRRYMRDHPDLFQILRQKLEKKYLGNLSSRLHSTDQ